MILKVIKKFIQCRENDEEPKSDYFKNDFLYFFLLFRKEQLEISLNTKFQKKQTIFRPLPMFIHIGSFLTE
jgi:hypothetical protein